MRVFALALSICLASTLAHASTVSLLPEDDTFVRGGNNANSVQTQGSLLIKEQGAPNFLRRALLKFDLSSVAGGINDAVLSLKLASTSGVTTTVQVYGLSDSLPDWSETTTTFNNAPALGATNFAGTTLLGTFNVADGQTAGTEYQFSSPALVNFLAAPGSDQEVTLGLRSTNTSDSSVLSFGSKETSAPGLRPTLNVTAVPLPAAGWALLAGLGMVVAVKRRSA